MKMSHQPSDDYWIPRRMKILELRFMGEKIPKSGDLPSFIPVNAVACRNAIMIQ